MKRNRSLSLLLICITILPLLKPVYCVVDPKYEACVPKRCGNQTIKFPFRIGNETESFCGYPGFDLICRKNHSFLQLGNNDDLVIQQIFYNNQSVRIFSSAVLDLRNNCLPEIQSNFTLDGNAKFNNVSTILDLFLFYNCSGLTHELSRYHQVKKCADDGSTGLAIFGDDRNWHHAVEKCNRSVVVPVGKVGNNGEKIEIWGEMEEKVGGISMNWTASNCSECEISGGRCGFDLGNYVFKCYCPDRPHAAKCDNTPTTTIPGKSHLKLILALVVPIPLAIILSSIICIVCCRKKWRVVSPFIRRTISFAPFSKADIEGRNVCFEVPLFSYAELQEATKNFSASEELGDGGFGAVYYGKLKDGREVAVKRLYEHNYMRVSQFVNEIEILTRIRHRNLVSLYGCTSRRSQELLLVYEYIPNGTVADHLNGDRAKDSPLSWPIRMNIAIETASALAYLHASDIIHRDVKTTNILLDSSFCVKVADFGLSRLLPADVTHISTTPQGTPGYVDPEYHQCYQLTDKSDVYSFGVVLIELISSMPAVDISRDRHEINLANLAINKIQSHALSDLIDPSLGFYSDPCIERMITSVAEVAFRCLQLEKEMRPTMDEVWNTLKEILEYQEEKSDDSGGLPRSGVPHPSPEGDGILLLKNRQKAVPPSPDSVTARWILSSSDTSVCSG